MKMVKSLLLGTAAGLVAVAGAQAADMPVKAKPVAVREDLQPLRRRLLLHPGHRYLPQVGGYVRGEYAWNAGASQTNGHSKVALLNRAIKDRFDGEDWYMRTRAYAWFDSRQQTEYGTLRTYLQMGVNYDSPQVTGTTSTRTGPSSSSPGSPSVPRSRSSTSIRLRRARTGERWRATRVTAAGRSSPIPCNSATASRRRSRSKSRATLARRVPTRAFSTPTSATRASFSARSRLIPIGPRSASPTSWRTGASTRLGAVPRSWVRSMTSAPATMPTLWGWRPAPARPLPPVSSGHGGWLDHRFRSLRPSCRQAGLGGRRRFQVQPLPR